MTIHKESSVSFSSSEKLTLNSEAVDFCHIGVGFEDPNCQKDGCHDDSGHCSLHCSGLHNLFVLIADVKIHSEYSHLNKNEWAFKYLYNQPILDSFLKPPLYS